jgi:hypothetical protein
MERSFLFASRVLSGFIRFRLVLFFAPAVAVEFKIRQNQTKREKSGTSNEIKRWMGAYENTQLRWALRSLH